MYTDDVLRRRMALRYEPQVVEMLQRFWEAALYVRSTLQSHTATRVLEQMLG
jgi:hypothetical protein